MYYHTAGYGHVDSIKVSQRNSLLNALLGVRLNARLGVFAALLVSALAACTAVPVQLEGEYADLSPARVGTTEFGTAVRWGGVLVDTRNESDRTCFEVLSRVLDRYQRPLVNDDYTEGRFIACTNGFHDPEIYSKGREVTITGVVQNLEQRQIEEFDYRYPVVEIDNLVLWETRKTVMMYRNYYDPFYYPYYWGGGPYWGYYPYYRYGGPYFHGYGYGPGFGYGGGVAYPRELTPQPSTILSRDE